MTAVNYGILQTEPSSADLTWYCPPGFRVVLGSQSATRRTILSEMKTQFECISPNIDEKAIRMEKPEDLVLALARAKAEALKVDKRLAGHLASGDTTLLLTCDQVVVHDNKILEKPESKDQAREFIRGYGRSPCSTVGATVVTNLATG
eukprot:CAMPEP_0172192850 /NCGR_PEP_ID=MMETSP1050-20130122/24592_1 /TAXON_ID=233186 /ORGANISM="Cryptomonas curvata, Strain CCAP979/52" /LENGTH=147 /DNA_ID=CAMNT_0012868269 /DNA_START=139 /DNA_END=578 /DNA_ORIENTATION=-